MYLPYGRFDEQLSKLSATKPPNCKFYSKSTKNKLRNIYHVVLNTYDTILETLLDSMYSSGILQTITILLIYLISYLLARRLEVCGKVSI